MDIQSIQQRNARVEADKAWETSRTRKAAIAALTYCVAYLYLSLLNVGYAYLHALTPAGGYVLSTLSLSILKKIWLEKIYKKEMLHEN